MRTENILPWIGGIIVAEIMTASEYRFSRDFLGKSLSIVDKKS
jgi:hypothetical protein